MVVDTFGLLMTVMVTPAGQPDRNAARELLARLRMLHPQLTLIWGDFERKPSHSEAHLPPSHS
ncbi:hypothetical protein ACIBQ1_40830 [Nonomuraea sp. NPDC050153]|uniref:hypothetical protein n=1 Tax=Nonomuraea sp. NPDC050153 TaxID=3364359 RepID=UPI00379D8754